MNKRDESYATEPALVEWRSEDLPYSNRFSDIYYPSVGAIDQSYSVFLQANGVPRRWNECSHNQTTFTIGELGFGTGLNFALTLKEWRRANSPLDRLYYVSFERFPLAHEELNRALSRFPELKEEKEQLLSLYPPLLPGAHRIAFKDSGVILDLVFDEALSGLEQKRFIADAWYLDGFDPKKNESLWNEELFSSLNKHSHPKTTLGTYSSAGWVRRALESAGCTVEKVSNSRGKRETIRGEFSKGKAPSSITAQEDTARQRNIRIIGGGYAGLTLAQTFAERKIPVTVVEREESFCMKASGNPQGVILPYITRKPSIQSELYLSCYGYALRALSQKELSKKDFDTPGIIHFPSTDRLKSLLERLSTLHVPESIASILSKEEVAEHLSTEVSSEAFLYPSGSWIRPKEIAKAILDNELISFEALQEVTHFKEESEENLDIYCSAFEASKAPHSKDLPLEPVRGQILQIESTSLTEQLKKILCFDGYLLPSVRGEHLLGATYEHNSLDETIRDEDNEKMIGNLTQWCPEWKLDLRKVTGSRVAFRTSTRDRLPLVGPLSLPDETSLSTALPYFFVGFGSRGFTSIPLLAEELVCELLGEPTPLLFRTAQAVSASRFRKKRMQKQ